jgi:phenylalanine-4-hydroxylase
MNWWTVEYGLVGPLESPKIYGAGLLSSVGESYHCLSSKVKKIPLSIDCVKVPYDITRPQPQLFVTPNFRTLSKVLEEFSETMAYRVGGLAALRIAIAARTITTTQFDSEVQIGGRLVEAITDSLENPAYLRFEGPCQLAYGDHEISDQGPRQHPEGFGTPVGQVVWNGSLRRPQSLKDPEIQGVTELLFDSNVRVRGKLVSSIRRAGNLAVLTFENCWVTLGDRILFRPEWGLYDLACGSAVSSVYGGAPDRAKYSIATETTPLQRGFQKTNLTDETIVLNELYSEVRRVRERGQREDTVERLNRVHEALERDHPSDWLLRMELLELDQLWRLFSPWRSAVLTRVAEIARSKPELAQVIRRGMELIA